MRTRLTTRGRVVICLAIITLALFANARFASNVNSETGQPVHPIEKGAVR